MRAELVTTFKSGGAMLASIQIAEHKARHATTFRRPTRIFEDGILRMHLNYLLAFDGIIASRGGISTDRQGSDYRRNRLVGRASLRAYQRARGVSIDRNTLLCLPFHCVLCYAAPARLELLQY
jgi:hypothetical protein